jgi:hypothetical protein
MQNTIIFTLRSGLSTAKQEEFLDEVRGWDGVEAVGRLNPQAIGSDGGGECFVYINSDKNVDRFAQRLKGNWSVDEASVQPYRYAAAI